MPRTSFGTMLSGIPAPSRLSMPITLLTPSTCCISSVMFRTSCCGTSLSTSSRCVVAMLKVSSSFLLAITDSSSCGITLLMS